MTKKSFCFKNPFFAKNAIFSKIMSQSKDNFWIIQAPYISKHISRNGGATIKASRKTAPDKVFYFGAKRPFLLQKGRHHQKKLIALNMYIGTNVLVYERWSVLKVRYTAGQPPGPTLSPFHRLTLLVHVSQKFVNLDTTKLFCTICNCNLKLLNCSVPSAIVI